MTRLLVKAGAFREVAAELVAVKEPSITQWQRLEADPAEIDLAAGLDAAVADPLWMIGRQWQFAELKGENAAMPIWAELEGEWGRFGLPGRSGGPVELPEPLIEAEPARGDVPALALQAGLDLESALAEAAAEAVAAFRAAFPVRLSLRSADEEGDDPAAVARVYWIDPADEDGIRLAAVVGTRGIDAVALAAALANADRGPDGALVELPAALALADGLRPAVLAALRDWLEDWDALLVEGGEGGFWQPRRMEYAFAMEAETREGVVPLAVNEYADGRLDWWSLDRAGDARPGAGSVTPFSVGRVPLSVRFPGMPADRLFEFEDGGFNLGPVTAGPTGMCAMLMIEFFMAASNDWYQLPLSGDHGSSFRLRRLSVLDTFGDRTPVEPAAAGPGGWSMFTVTRPGAASEGDALFILPSTVAGQLQSEPIEEVAFFRDEMANLVWAVERQTPGATLAPLREPPDAATVHQRIDADRPVDAATIYRLQTPTPLNWFPMTAEQDPEGPAGSVVLRLRQLSRSLASGDVNQARAPRGALLKGENDSFLLEEREVPRSGLVVSRHFQYARDAAGNRLVWLGRRKQVGRGEGSSRLRFDVLEPVDREA